MGQTTGRTRQSQRHRDNQVHAPVKDVYLYPLSSDARQTSVDKSLAESRSWGQTDPTGLADVHF